MEQSQLRRLERRCIQEEPAKCTAACPIHVDARALAAKAAEGDWPGAWKALQKTMPLCGILARICDAPCEAACVRGGSGGAVRIGALEKACALTPAPPLKFPRLPKKSATAAVLGGGLSGLTAAWDLAKKGYPVTMLEAGRPAGQSLLQDYQGRLTKEAVEGELKALFDLGVAVEQAPGWQDEGFIDSCLERFGALYLCLDEIGGLPPGLEMRYDESGPKPAGLQVTTREGVFAGGDSPSPVWRAAQGRWAAASMDRMLQKVSMSAGREKQGPYESRLFTSTQGVEPLPPVAPASPDGMYTAGEAQKEAGRCLNCQCLECVKVCAYLEGFGSYPKKYAREIYNNESIVMGSRLSNKLINSCSLCGLCQEVCPNDFAMRDLCLQTRRSMVSRGKMPPSAHEFALLDMEFSRGQRFALCKHQPGMGSSRFVFFPGCQLAASNPEQTAAVYRRLAQSLDGGVGLMLGCCGAPAHWGGDEGLNQGAAGEWKGNWQGLGEPKVITACSTCHAMFKEFQPQAGLASLWEILDGLDWPEIKAAPLGPLAVHDPCTTRGEPGVQKAVRSLLQKAGVKVEELELSGGLTQCCGYGGLMENANPELARESVKRRSQQSGRDYLTYCAMCRDALAGVGKPALHMLDILFPDHREQGNPAKRPRPGWSQRRENRSWLKASLLRDEWNQEAPAMEETGVKLIISPEVRQMLDERRILDEDLRAAISQAEKTGQKLVNPENGRFKAAAQPFKAVFWVEYSPAGDGYEVHNAYSHRMTVAAGGRI